MVSFGSEKESREDCVKTYNEDYPEIHERKLLEQAVAEARQRTEALANASGVKLGTVEAIMHEYRYASRSGVIQEFHESLFTLDTADKIGSVPNSAPEFNPETISVSCSVSLRWGLE